MELNTDLDDASQSDAWLRTFLAVVDFNFLRGLVWFCVSCEMGLHDEEHFNEGSDHSNHLHLRVHDIGGSICVSKSDLNRLKVDIGQIQLIPADSFNADAEQLYIYVKNTYSFLPETAAAATLLSLANGRPQPVCVSCPNEIQFVKEQTSFCSLECKRIFSDYVAGPKNPAIRFRDTWSSVLNDSPAHAFHSDGALRARGDFQRGQYIQQQEPPWDKRSMSAISGKAYGGKNGSQTWQLVQDSGRRFSDLNTVLETTVDGQNCDWLQPICDKSNLIMMGGDRRHRALDKVHLLAENSDLANSDYSLYMLSEKLDNSDLNEPEKLVNAKSSGFTEELRFPFVNHEDSSVPNEVSQQNIDRDSRRGLDSSVGSHAYDQLERSWRLPSGSDSDAGSNAVIEHETRCKLVRLHEVKISGQMSYIAKDMQEKPRKCLYLDKKLGEAIIFEESMREPEKASSPTALGSSVSRWEGGSMQIHMPVAQNHVLVKAHPAHDHRSRMVGECKHFPHCADHDGTNRRASLAMKEQEHQTLWARSGQALHTLVQANREVETRVEDGDDGDALPDDLEFVTGSADGNAALPWLHCLRMPAEEDLEEAAFSTASARIISKGESSDEPIELGIQIPLLERLFLPFIVTPGEWPMMSNFTVFDGLRPNR